MPAKRAATQIVVDRLIESQGEPPWTVSIRIERSGKPSTERELADEVFATITKNGRIGHLAKSISFDLRARS